MKLDMNKTHNKFIVLLLIAVPILTIGFLFTYWTQIQTDADVVKTQPVLEEPHQKQIPLKWKGQNLSLFQPSLKKIWMPPN